MTEPDPETLAITADFGISAVNRQLSDADTLAGRGYQLAGFASVVIGLAAVGKGGPAWLLWPALAAYLACLAGCWLTVKAREYHGVSTPKGLWETNWQSSPTELRHAIVHSAAEVFEKNDAASKARITGLKVAMNALVVETVLVAIRMVISA